MRLIGIDPGTHTGWATFDGKHVESGVQHFDLRRGESPGMRFLRFREWLSVLCDLIRPALLVYEAAHHRGGAATEVLVGMTTRIQEIAAEKGCEHESVHTKTLKKWATGDGRASKNDMIEAAQGFNPRGDLILDDNRADALLILAYAREQHD